MLELHAMPKGNMTLAVNVFYLRSSNVVQMNSLTRSPPKEVVAKCSVNI